MAQSRITRNTQWIMIITVGWLWILTISSRRVYSFRDVGCDEKTLLYVTWIVLLLLLLL
jgi:hypothetical protein